MNQEYIIPPREFFWYGVVQDGGYGLYGPLLYRGGDYYICANPDPVYSEDSVLAPMIG